METLSFDLLLRMLIAHFLSDFVLQKKSWAEKKDKLGIKSGFFWLHFIITTIVLFIFLWNWELWPVLLFVSVGHLIVDAIKSKMNNEKAWVFIIDQLLHVLIIIFAWLLCTKQMDLLYQSLSRFLSNPQLLFITLSYILLSTPASVFIRKITLKWSKNLKEKDNGLENAGKWIGILERFLIFTFIIIDEISAIGFLLAAKSVFRFGELKDANEQRKTEYIIIGTFLSFAISIFIGIICNSNIIR